jgi:hypothetical protein
MPSGFTSYVGEIVIWIVMTYWFVKATALNVGCVEEVSTGEYQTESNGI